MSINSAETDSAAEKDSFNNDMERKFNEEQGTRYHDSVQKPEKFLDALWNKKGSSNLAMFDACQDIKFELETAEPEEEEVLLVINH